MHDFPFIATGATGGDIQIVREEWCTTSTMPAISMAKACTKEDSEKQKTAKRKGESR
jgi:hypothetical protein